MNTNSVFRLSLLAVSLGATLLASADQIVHRFATEYADNFGGAQTYDAFDPSLGTLNSVVVDLDIHVSGFVSYLNRGASADGFELGSEGYGLVNLFHADRDDPNVNDFFGQVYGYNGYIDQIGTLGTGQAFTNDLSYDGGVNGDFVYDADGNVLETDTGVFTGPALDGFIAHSPTDQTSLYYAVAYDAYHNMTLPHSTYTQRFGGSMTGSITYNFTPVPEPSVLAALGLGSLAVLRRRK